MKDDVGRDGEDASVVCEGDGALVCVEADSERAGSRCGRWGCRGGGGDRRRSNVVWRGTGDEDWFRIDVNFAWRGRGRGVPPLAPVAITITITVPPSIAPVSVAALSVAGLAGSSGGALSRGHGAAADDCAALHDRAVVEDEFVEVPRETWGGGDVWSGDEARDALCAVGRVAF